MATNLVFRNDNKRNRADDLGETIAPGTPVRDSAGQPAVAVTGSGDYTRSEVIEGVGTLSGIAAGGASLEGTEVSLASDGTWEFDAEVFGGDLPSVSHVDPIYFVANGELSDSGSDEDLFGTVDYPIEYDTTRGFIPVKIGA